MADDCRMIVDQLRFGNHNIEYNKSKKITFRNAVGAVWSFEVLFYRPFGLRLSLPHYLRLRRTWVKLNCEKLRKRVYVEAKIQIKSRDSSDINKEAIIKNFFEKGDSSCEVVTIFEDVSEKIPELKVLGELKIYVNPENYFYYRYRLGFLPSESQLQATRLQIINEFSNDLLAALSQEHTSDVVLRCETKSYKAHKVVLSARSKRFLAMFQNPLEENETNVVFPNSLEENETYVVDIKDMSSLTLQALLEYIYSGNVTIQDYEKAFQLVTAADQYDLPGLKKLSLHYLQSKLSLTNALEILTFADKYDENLKKKSIDYICIEYEKIKKTEKWCDLQNHQPQLANEVLQNIMEFVNSDIRK